MPLKFEPAFIPLAGGLDTKTDPRALEPPGLTRCENAIFDRVGGIQKRPGTTVMPLAIAGGGTVDPAALAARDDEKLAFGDGKLLSYSPLTEEWYQRGEHYGCYVEQEVTQVATALYERAESGGVVVYVEQSKFHVYDGTTGAYLGTRDLSASARGMRCVAANSANGQWVMVYWWNFGNSSIESVKVDSESPRTSLTVTPTEYVTDVGTSGHFDVAAELGADHLVVYTDAAGTYGLIAVNNTDPGGLDFTTATKARTSTGAIGVHYHAAFWSIARDDGSAIRYDQLNDSLADTVANTAVRTYASAPRYITVAQLGGGSGTAYVVWNEGRAVWRGHVVAGSLSSAGVMVQNSQIQSRPEIWGGGGSERVVMFLAYSPGHANDLLNYQHIAWDVSKTVTDGQFGVLARMHPGVGAGIGGGSTFTTWAPLGRPQLLSSNRLAHALIYFESAPTTDPLDTNFAELSSSTCWIDMNDPRAYDGVQMGPTLYLPGGYLAAYDGTRLYEAVAFCAPHPDNTTTPIIGSDSGGNLGVGAGAISYAYRFYWEFRNDQGERERGPYVGDIHVNTFGLSGTDNSASFTIPTCPYTGKQMYLVVYRTQVDPGPGAQFFKCSPDEYSSAAESANAWVYNDPTAATVTWEEDTTHGFTDAEIAEREIDYVSRGELANIHCPFPPQAIAAGQSRLFAFGPLKRNTVYASKLRFDGEVPGFDQAESAKILVPERGGRVTAVLPREDSVLVFSERSVSLAGGVGPDNTGAGSWDIPGIIEETIGCSAARALGVVPGGALFHNDRGFYAIDSGFRVTYVGGPVDEYKNRAIRGIVTREGQHQVIVATTTGALLFDTVTQQWSDWQGTPWNSADVAILGGEVHVVSGANIYALDESTYLDNTTAYSLVVETAWIKLGGILGYQKARFWEVLGEYRAAHELRVKIGYNFETEWVDDLTWSVPADDAGEPERAKGRFSFMKSPAVRFLIQDDNHGSVVRGESLHLTALGIEIATKSGLARVPRIDKVGP